MPDGSDTDLTVALANGVGEIAGADWDRLAGPDNPTISHTFLRVLEESGSVGGETGWIPRPLTVHGADGTLLGAVPLYLKLHSYGEYVFDHGWANAFERAGGRYYPKLQVAVPFTPVPGPRLLLHPDAPATVLPVMIRTLESIAARNGFSSVHVTFPREADWQALGDAGWLQRIGTQYHWENRGYGSFDDFLTCFSARKRKAVRKERKTVAECGPELVTLTGGDIAPEHWDAFHRCYIATSDRKWGSPYLTRDFFHRLGAAMADKVVLVMARHRGEWVAGALNLLGTDTLYGRNWGCLGDWPFLHFEACYYRAIDFAIAQGLKRVEAGAQGEHKIQRGYMPTRTYSAHHIVHPGLRGAVADFLERERVAVEGEIAMLAAEGPYRQEGTG